jgi:transposase
MEALAETHHGSVQMIDTSVVRVHPHCGCVGGRETRLMGRSRGGLTTKIHACVDTNGMPVRLELTTGEAHDNRLVTELLSDLKSGAMLLADRAYDADWIRAFAGEHGAWANIPPKRNRNDPICFSPYLYRARNLVERFFNRIKQCRRVATRYDKLAANYLAFIKLAAIRVWLRGTSRQTACSRARAIRRSRGLLVEFPIAREDHQSRHRQYCLGYRDRRAESFRPQPAAVPETLCHPFATAKIVVWPGTCSVRAGT